MRDRQEDDDNRMEAVLAALQVHLGFPDEREKMAEALVRAGITPLQVQAVARTVRSGKSAPAALAKVLGNPDDVRKRAADVRRCDTVKRWSEGPPAGQGHGVVNDVMKSQEFEAHKQRMAYGLVVADGKSPDFVASLFTSVTVEQVNQWVEAERKLREQDKPKKVRKQPPEDPELAKLSHEERIDKFRKDYGHVDPHRASENAAFFDEHLHKRSADAKKNGRRDR